MGYKELRGYSPDDSSCFVPFRPPEQSTLQLQLASPALPLSPAGWWFYQRRDSIYGNHLQQQTVSLRIFFHNLAFLVDPPGTTRKNWFILRLETPTTRNDPSIEGVTFKVNMSERNVRQHRWWVWWQKQKIRVSCTTMSTHDMFEQCILNSQRPLHKGFSSLQWLLWLL